jgi:hypothetical protein
VSERSGAMSRPRPGVARSKIATGCLLRPY